MSCRNPHLPDQAVSVWLEVKGWVCPLPVLRAQKALDAMAASAVLCITGIEPRRIADFHEFCHDHGHAILAQAPDDDATLRLYLRKAQRPAEKSQSSKIANP